MNTTFMNNKITSVFISSLLIIFAIFGITNRVLARDSGCYDTATVEGRQDFVKIDCPNGLSPSGATCFWKFSPATNVASNFTEANCETMTTNQEDTAPGSGSGGGGVGDLAGDADGQKLVDWVNRGINLMSALTGVAIAGSLIFAGIQYSMAGGNPQASAAAKKRISNAILALMVSVFMYAFLQWIVPGGIF